ncbi:MAG: PQQ-dependent sugar dehydrogenase [Rhizobiales bacterium]|nr:PQQ-dependent sugar dehydrogenase [Hyphomicrobiales bacterium]MBI3673572.1 PQQ-dependent sugar dehydrogenase [Hyphomicrobiales bacterium]
MLKRLLIVVVVTVATAVALVVWFTDNVFNPPPVALADGNWEQILLQRVKPPAGYEFKVFAHGLSRPRLMAMTAAGDLIVSGYTSGNIYLLKADRNGDGKSDGTTVLKEGLDNPHELVLEGNVLYVAEEQEVVAFDFDEAALSNRRVILDGLPTGGAHTSRTLRRGPDGYFYLTIGSSCNSCLELNSWRAAMLRFKEGEAPTIFASGLRNTVGFDWQPGTGRLYGVDNGRDNMGDDVPDDEVNLIEPGKNYGWPYVHGMGVADPILPMPSGLNATLPVHGLGAHVAPLSILFLKEAPDTALVTEHGSWNRTVKAGYRIVKLTFAGGKVSEEPFLTGCEEKGNVICRPVGLLEAPDGSLYVTDDYAGAVYLLRKLP